MYMSLNDDFPSVPLSSSTKKLMNSKTAVLQQFDDHLYYIFTILIYHNSGLLVAICKGLAKTKI